MHAESVVVIPCSIHGKTDMDAGDIVVTEAGVEKPVRAIRFEKDLPVTIGLLVDVSGSQGPLIEEHRQLVARLSAGLLHAGDDAFLITIATQVKLLAELNGQPQTFASAAALIDKTQMSGDPFGDPCKHAWWKNACWGTAIWNSVYYSARIRMKQATGRKAIVLITDGQDRGSEHGLDDAIEAAQETDTAVYAIRYPQDFRFIPEWLKHPPTLGLKRLAEETGGATYDSQTGLGSILADLTDKLRSQYLIEYVSGLGSTAKLQVTVRPSHPGLSVRARHPYRLAERSL
jgi:Ca-activated chloride channel homolog